MLRRAQHCPEHVERTMITNAPQGQETDPPLSVKAKMKAFSRTCAGHLRALVPFITAAMFGVSAQLFPAAGLSGVFAFSAPFGGQASIEETVLLEGGGKQRAASAPSPFVVPVLNSAAALAASKEPGVSGVASDQNGFLSGDDAFVDDAVWDDEGNFFFASLSPLTTDSAQNDRRTVADHTVQEGENLSTIAADYGVTVNTLIWANSNRLKNPDLLRLGDILTIPPVSGVLHAVKTGDTVDSLAKKYRADSAKIIAFNALPADGSLQAGSVVVVPDGRIPPPPVPPKPSTSRVAQGAPKIATTAGSGYYRVPLASGYRRVRGVSRRHRGVDLAASCGTSLYAAAAGTVTRSDPTGWNGGFGKVIVIKHPNGTETLYAHGSILYVDAGTAVAQGQLIMAMGTTGLSTGCHLHFEVHGAGNPF